MGMDNVGFLWIGAGLIGAIMLIAKGKLHLGYWTWFLFGWWGILIAIVLGGGLLLLLGILAKAPVKCPACRKSIDRQATKCPYCQTVLAPAHPSGQSPIGSAPLLVSTPAQFTPAGRDMDSLLKEVNVMVRDGTIDEVEANERRRQILANS